MVTVNTNRASIAMLLLGVALIAFVFGFLVGTPVQSKSDVPDWTIASCSLWAGNATPTLPPFTIQNACFEPDGTISTPDFAPINQQLPTE